MKSQCQSTLLWGEESQDLLSSSERHILVGAYILTFSCSAPSHTHTHTDDNQPSTHTWPRLSDSMAQRGDSRCAFASSESREYRYVICTDEKCVIKPIIKTKNTMVGPVENQRPRTYLSHMPGLLQYDLWPPAIRPLCSSNTTFVLQQYDL